MDSKDATREFVSLVRLGSAALKRTLAKDGQGEGTGEIFDEIDFLLDGLEDAADRLSQLVDAARPKRQG